MDQAATTTPCPLPCTVRVCDLSPEACHERHHERAVQLHDPERCERERAALDAHTRLAQELGVD